jgi:LPXTG-motif cell wall-anchored protein
MFRSVFYFAMIIFTSTILWGQEITFKAQASKTEVSVNERFSVRFVLTYGETNLSIDQQLKMPNFDGLHQLGESTLNSVSINNGEVHNISGIEVVLVADQEGEFTIGSATISIGGKRYKTNPIKISVKKGLKPKTEPGMRLQGAFLTTEVSENHPFLNQEVILTVKIYARDYSILNRLRNYKEPDFTHLVAKYVSEKVNNSVRQELVNGVTFVSQELARYILFPQKTGELEIDPFSIQVLISGYYGAENVELSSEPIRLKVKNLPPGKPENFSGAIGNYNLNASLSKKETKSNEAVKLEVEIIGSGNLNTLKTPKITMPEHIESFAPTKKEVIELRPSGMKGKVVENHVLVPAYGGEYQIGPISFSYFDPEHQKYVTLKTKPFELEVDGPEPPTQEELAKIDELNDHVRTDTTSSFEAIAVPKKIAQVKDQVVETVAKDNNWIWMVAGLGILLGGGYFFFGKKKNQPKKAISLTEKEKRNQFKAQIQQKLNDLKALADKQEQTAFMSLQEDILTQMGMYFSQTNLSDFTENSVEQKLKSTYGHLASDWKSLLLSCKESKYAYFGNSLNLKEKYQETEILWKNFLNS